MQYKKIMSILKLYKYRILIVSLIAFIIIMRLGQRTDIPFVNEGWEFKFALWIVIMITLLVSHGVHSRTTMIHGIVALLLLMITINPQQHIVLDFLMETIVLLFFCRITITIIKTLLVEQHISYDLLVWCIAWYILIAICAFLLFNSLDSYLWFKGFSFNFSQPNHIFGIMYYSFITLMTIGYGDIVHVMPSMQLLTMIVSLIWRSYTTFILAMVLKKFDSEWL